MRDDRSLHTGAMMRINILICVVAVILSLISGCQPVTASNNIPVDILVDSNAIANTYDIYRFEDQGNTCYIVHGIDGIAVSCIK